MEQHVQGPCGGGGGHGICIQGMSGAHTECVAWIEMAGDSTDNTWCRPCRLSLTLCPQGKENYCCSIGRKYSEQPAAS